MQKQPVRLTSANKGSNTKELIQYPMTIGHSLISGSTRAGKSVVPIVRPQFQTTTHKRRTLPVEGDHG